MLPTGTVTFLMTDLEGSTGLVTARRRLRGGDEAAARADPLAVAARAAPRSTCTATRSSRLRARVGGSGGGREIQRAFAAERVARRGDVRGIAATPAAELETGRARVRQRGLPRALDVHVVARLCAAAHGGQVVVSSATAELLPLDDTTDLGEHRLHGFERPLSIRQLEVEGAAARFRRFVPARDEGVLGDREPQLAQAALAALGAVRRLPRFARRRAHAVSPTRPGRPGTGARARRGRCARRSPRALRFALGSAAGRGGRPSRRRDRSPRADAPPAPSTAISPSSKTAEREAATSSTSWSCSTASSERAALSGELEPDRLRRRHRAATRTSSSPGRRLEAERRGVRHRCRSPGADCGEAEQALGDTARRLRRTASRACTASATSTPFRSSTRLASTGSGAFDSRAEAKAFAQTSGPAERAGAEDQLSAKADACGSPATECAGSVNGGWRRRRWDRS